MAMKGFLAAAAKKNTDIRDFLKDATGGNSIKYTAEKATKHLLFIPYTKEIVNINGEDEERKSIISISAHIHEWTGVDDKYHSTVCIKDVIRQDDDGNVLNDGVCPFCDRVDDAWEIFNIRKEREEQSCGKTGAELEKYMKEVTTKLASERKAKAASDYIYILVAKFRQDKNGSIIKNDKTNLPEYDLKVMRLTAKRSEKLQKTVDNSGVELAGTELLFDYPDTDDVRHLYQDSVTVPVIKGTNNSLISKFKGLEEAILADAEKFEWDGLEKSFPEWKGMSTSVAKSTVDGLFKKFDSYKKELETNPNAKYMEYLTASTAENPSMDIDGAKISEVPKLEVPNVDVNDAFGGITSL